MPITEPGVADADGIVEPGDNGTHVLRFERRLKHPIDRVWAALTDREELLGWWGSADELDLAEGGQIVLRWLNTDENGDQVVMHGKVVRIDPPHLLEYATDVHGVLRFALRDEGGVTVLSFTSTVTFPPEVHPVALAGWHLHLNFLDGLLGGRRANLVDLPTDKWERWRDQYEAALR